jgi:hypothetical protein
VVIVNPSNFFSHSGLAQLLRLRFRIIAICAPTLSDAALIVTLNLLGF